MALITGVRVVAWAIALAWVGKLVEAARGMRRVSNLLEAQYDIEPAGSPSVVVVVPARNEEANIDACLESLITQDYGNMRIVAVNDRSEDGTGAAMQALAEVHGGRLKVLAVEELPAGWLGKTHAMALAADVAIVRERPEYLLFTDADIIFRSDAVRRAVAEAEATRADHFVVLPTLIVKTRGEGMMLSYLQVTSLFAVRLWRVQDAKARDTVGIGAFNMMRTTAYESIGGFAALRMEIVEDMALGRQVKRARMRQRVAIAPGMVSVHWASGMSGILSGMTKNIFAVFRFRLGLLLGGTAGMALFSLGPVAMLGFRETRVPGIFALVGVAGLYVVSGRTTCVSWGYVVGFPFAAAALLYTMLRSTIVTLWNGGVTWRGTFYPLSKLRERS
jgi:glycosyltransferase involved in cell wall biosynthesis